MRAAKKSEPDPGKAVMLAYQLTMANGRTALDDPQSERCLDIKLKPLSQFMAEQLSGSSPTSPAVQGEAR